MHLLDNQIRNYAWGSTTAIAEALGKAPSGRPEAELWIGAHPDAPSATATGPLDQVIAEDPEHYLGAASRTAFGARLPFLTKLLAADAPLSLQVHPTLEQARAGFAAENSAGVPREAPHRNYKDDNHKPEMILALTDFEALCGFRPAPESAQLFQALAAAAQGQDGDGARLLRFCADTLTEATDESAALHSIVESLISGGDAVADAVEQAVESSSAIESLDSLQPQGNPSATAATLRDLAQEYPADPGALISLLLNRVSLDPGECLALPAGNMHAYLSGLGVEVMASSDNVLRGGLTPKHIDIPELLRTVDFRSLPVPRVTAELSELGQEIYRPGFAEFQLQRISSGPGAQPVPLAQRGPLLVLVLQGAARLDTPRGDLQLNRGQSAFVAAAEAPAMLHPVEQSPEGYLAFAVTTDLVTTDLEA
ncbi:mannose-6-phosphate isomerase, class I [Acaricomes phytoseiuli]|uniref:mannose-6-phosphate isomerase, class I n=1 Tax=Acaricomes phytoseiuli TaxID=291968 RepID=UPI000364869B|nr:mannose-6-phosphate isomerase, class I [Acaricomes phytoseiuli]